MDIQSREESFRQYRTILEDLRSSFVNKWKSNTFQRSSLNSFERFFTLGTGAFGRVILVKHRATSKYYAMKIMSKMKIIKTKQLRHIYNEKKILQCIKFPFMIFLEYCFKDNSYIYLVLPFISGGEMFTYLRKRGKFDESMVRFYAAQVTLALEYLHYCSLIYRDLKPENILIEKNGYLKLTDFGFSKLIDGKTWTMCGTPEYLAPEIILAKSYGQAVDWWSFGILIYEMSAGYPPFYSDNMMRMYEKIVSGKFKFVSHFSDDLKDILKNILQVNLTRRYGNLKDGPLDIKRHPFFKETDWLQVYNQTVEAEYKPFNEDPCVKSHFMKYPEERLHVSNENKFTKEFEDF